MIEIVRHTQRNVKRCQDGDMRKRWTAAGMLVAEQQFRRIIGHLEEAGARDRDRTPRRGRPTSPILTTEAPHILLSDRQPPGGRRQFHDDPGILLRASVPWP